MDCYSAGARLKLEPVSSHLPSLVEPFFLQKHNGVLMQHPCDPTQLGRQITQIVLSSPDPETVLQRLARAVGEIFQVDACSIAAQSTHHATAQTCLWRVDSEAAPALGDGASRLETLALFDVETLTEPLAIPDITADRTWSALSGHYREMRVRAVLVMATQFQSQPNGVIILGRSQAGDWSESEKQLLMAVSEPVAIAISQVQLLRQVRTATKHHTAIEQLTMAIRSTNEIDQILHQALASTAQALQVDRGEILMLKYTDPLWKRESIKRVPKAKATVVCEWSSTGSASGIPEQQQNSQSLLTHTFWLSDCRWCQQAFINAPEPLALADIHSLPPDESASEEIGCMFASSAMPALLMVPLLGTKSEASVQSTVLGFLVLQHDRPRTWQPDELDLVKWMSAQASTAIIQSQTLQQVQALVEERTAQLQSSLEVQAKLYEKTRHQIDQLRHLNQLKDEFLSTVSHELRTPLTNMALAIRMLRQPQLPSERRAKYLDILEQQCNQEINLINDLLTLQQLDSNHLSIQVQKIDLKPIVENLAESFEQRWSDKGLSLAVDLPSQSVMLETEPESLNRIVLELLTNAGKYSQPDTTVHLRVSHQLERQVERVVLTVSNIGAGISPTEITHIFDKFRRAQGVTQQAIPGTGLGLALVKSLVEHLNGTIAVESSPTDSAKSWETCFTLTLPKFFDRTKV